MADNWAVIESDWKAKAKERLALQEEKTEARRDALEDRIQRTIGRELNSAEIQNLRYDFRQLEECETELERIAERYNNYE